MVKYQESKVWQAAFENSKSKHKEAEAKLKASYDEVRTKVMHLAEAYRQHNPGFTNHSIHHVDTLWLIADQILPKPGYLNPLETYLLGLAFLTHDLGMGIATYRGGENEIKKDKKYQDLYAIRTRTATGKKKPSHTDAIAEYLRLHHADKALSLLNDEFVVDKERMYLLGSGTSLASLAGIAGEIAASHHWSLDDVRERLPKVCPSSWTDGHQWVASPHKIAGVLRICDACHISGDRANPWGEVGNKFSELSKKHWRFHRHLGLVTRVDRVLQFNSTEPFTVEESEEWWLAYDAIDVVDREIRGVRALFREREIEDLGLDGVDGAGRPESLVQLVKTLGWKPTNTRLKVSDVGKLVESLGGVHLYGGDHTVPLRELIQNSRDALEARRQLDKEDCPCGRITIRFVNKGEELWLEVEDNGVGMSEAVLAGPLLDFGSSFWSSDMSMKEFPGLSVTDFKAAGRFGIGFFSVFMLGSRVQVVSRRMEAARTDTKVLDFMDGANSPPLLREAAQNEQLADGGTLVRCRIDNPEWNLPGEIAEFWRDAGKQNGGRQSLRELLAYLAPSLDFDLDGQWRNDDPVRAVRAGDWLSIDVQELSARMFKPNDFGAFRLPLTFESVSELKDDKGNLLGRGALNFQQVGTEKHQCVVVSGGIRCGTTMGPWGVFIGEPLNVARTEGLIWAEWIDLMPFFRDQIDKYSQWIHELSSRGATLTFGGSHLALCSAINYWPESLPIGYSDGLFLVRHLESLREKPNFAVAEFDAGYFIETPLQLDGVEFRTWPSYWQLTCSAWSTWGPLGRRRVREDRLLQTFGCSTIANFLNLTRDISGQDWVAIPSRKQLTASVQGQAPDARATVQIPNAYLVSFMRTPISDPAP